MKLLLRMLTVLFAINFLVFAVGVGAMFVMGKLDQSKVQAVNQIVFYDQEPNFDAPKEAADKALPPELDVDAHGVEGVKRTIDAQVALLDRRRRELDQRQSTLDLATKKLKQARDKLKGERVALEEAKKAEAARLADKGFQDTLELYRTISAKQTKAIFMNLELDEVVEYMQAMDARIAARIIKEFKTPAELERIQKVLERMRSAHAKSDTGGGG